MRTLSQRVCALAAACGVRGRLRLAWRVPSADRTRAQVTSVQEALHVFRIIEFGRPIARRCRDFAEQNFWAISGGKEAGAEGEAEGRALADFRAWTRRRLWQVSEGDDEALRQQSGDSEAAS